MGKAPEERINKMRLVTTMATGTALGRAALVPAGSASATTRCRPPRGPGDNLVHSYGVKVRGLNPRHYAVCDVAHHIILSAGLHPWHRYSSRGWPWYCRTEHR